MLEAKAITRRLKNWNLIQHDTCKKSCFGLNFEYLKSILSTAIKKYTSNSAI